MARAFSRSHVAAMLSSVALAVPLILGSLAAKAAVANQVLPMPEVDVSKPASGPQAVTFAGGCFWGVQAVFAHVDGVTNAVSGYAEAAVPMRPTRRSAPVRPLMPRRCA